MFLQKLFDRIKKIEECFDKDRDLSVENTKLANNIKDRFEKRIALLEFKDENPQLFKKAQRIKKVLVIDVRIKQEDSIWREYDIFDFRDNARKVWKEVDLLTYKTEKK